MAVPSEVAKPRVIGVVAVPARVTVKVAVPAPSLTITSLMVARGRSSVGVTPGGTVPVPSSMMVPMPVSSAMRALTLGLVSWILKVSAPS